MPDSLWPHGLCGSWNYPGQNTGVGSLSLLQGIFPSQESNPGLPRCGQILYQLSHKGSPRILEWVAYPFSSGSSWPRNRTGVSCIAGGFFTNWAIRETPQVRKEILFVHPSFVSLRCHPYLKSLARIHIEVPTKTHGSSTFTCHALPSCSRLSLSYNASSRAPYPLHNWMQYLPLQWFWLQSQIHF